jgi:peroxiredoxin
MAALDSGTHAPQVVLPDLKGKTVSLSVELKRGPVVLAFFKISCPVCQYALPILERLHRAYPNAAIYGVSQNSAKDTERFCREFGVTFPMLLDDPNTYTASNAYGLTNVPTVFYIGQDGTIEVSSVGWSKSDVEEIGGRLGAAPNVSGAPLFKPGEEVADFRAG